MAPGPRPPPFLVLAARLGVHPSEELAQDGLKTLRFALSDLDKAWLGGKVFKGAEASSGSSSEAGGGPQRFMCGPQICVADLLCACELEQLVMLDVAKHGVDMAVILAGHTRVGGGLGGWLGTRG